MTAATLPRDDLERLLDDHDERACELWTRPVPLFLVELEPCGNPAAWVIHIRCVHGRGVCPSTLLVCEPCLFRIGCGQRLACRDGSPDPVEIVWTEPLR